MSLTAEDKQEISKMLTNNKPNSVFDGNVTEWLFRGLLGLLLYLGNGIRVEQSQMVEDMASVKSDIQQIKTENAYYGKDLESFRSILAKPRFTQEDFNQNISPLLKQLNVNTTELNIRNDRISSIEKDIVKLNYQVSEILKLDSK